MKLLNWYRREGFVQFMLGNAWLGRPAGPRGTLGVWLFCWAIILVGCLPAYFIFFY